jgi:hypothetical protein
MLLSKSYDSDNDEDDDSDDKLQSLLVKDDESGDDDSYVDNEPVGCKNEYDAKYYCEECHEIDILCSRASSSTRKSHLEFVTEQMNLTR